MAATLRRRRVLRSWESLKGEHWPTLLVGNGLSINVWSGFSYKKLLDAASLNGAAGKIFRQLRTENFETVLAGLWHAQTVLDALSRDRRDVDSMYLHVRQELINAVRRVHVPWMSVPTATLNQIGHAMDVYALVFTLNYDLLSYWAVMETPDACIGDFFWTSNGTFDATDADLMTGRTGLLYLHGGVHLWQDSRAGQVGKWTSQTSGSLLSGLGRSLRSSLSPDPPCSLVIGCS
jgi:hypothetical protein